MTSLQQLTTERTEFVYNKENDWFLKAHKRKFRIVIPE